MTAKYKEYFERMIRNNKIAFDNFSKVYNEYIKDQDNLQERYNIEGQKILEIIREWENKLCAQTEKAGFGNYSTNLSEKFWFEIRKMYPLIDYIGVVSKKEPSFKIKRIKL